jgi:hypothetical protein
MTVESSRLEEARQCAIPWKKWGPYLSERQWGTVREDYSEDGNAWDYFSYDQARSRAYRWGEDGLAGISDDKQRLCFALALWNGNDPILKERLFGLTNKEGNHGEDVKEYYFYLDNTPTHSYMKYLYKYPHSAFPYTELVQANQRRSRHELISGKGLLFIEPGQQASPNPVIDHITRSMSAAFRQARASAWASGGYHRCCCGALSEDHEFHLPNGDLTNSLCVHYVAHHRSEVPQEQLERIEAFTFGEAEPTGEELQGP